MKKVNAIVCASVVGLAINSASAVDFRYGESTKITGGAMVGMMKFAGAFNKEAKQAMAPMTSSILVKGNRKAHIDPNFTEIIDLDKETVTRIDHHKKEYTVMTFQQMKQQMEEAEKKAQERQARETHKQPENTAEMPKMDFKVNVRNTGATKNVSGLDAKESILSMAVEGTDQKSGQKGALAMTNDMWMAPEIPGYSEVRDFDKRYAVKMGMVFGDVLRPSLGAFQPGSSQGMAEMVKEMSKLKGTPVLQVMRMGSTTNGQPLPAASEAPLPQSNGPSAGDAAKQGLASSIAGALGPFGRHKKQNSDDQQTSQTATQGNQPAQSVLVESTTELSAFSSAPLDNSQFEVPAGYKQVEPDKLH